MLCYAMLRYSMLCYAPCYAMLCYAVYVFQLTRILCVLCLTHMYVCLCIYVCHTLRCVAEGYNAIGFYIIVKSGLVGVLIVLSFGQLMPELLAQVSPSPNPDPSSIPSTNTNINHYPFPYPQPLNRNILSSSWTCLGLTQWVLYRSCSTA